MVRGYVIQRKFKTMMLKPQDTVMKYTRKLRMRLDGRLPHAIGENYDKHWKYVEFTGKTVLDLGADLGSTAEYFLLNGARRVVAVEGNGESASSLYCNFGNDKRATCIEKWIATGKDVGQLIETFLPDVVKVDIEGAEKAILDVDAGTLVKVKEWLIETHTDRLHAAIKGFFLQNGFRVATVEYGKTLGKPEIKVVVARRGTADG